MSSTSDMSFELVWQDLGFKVGSKTILENSYGWLRSGQMLALMGPSGAGKSTLLECLIGKRVSSRSGEVFIRGCSLSSAKIAFIPQEDNYFDVLTVRESVMFASKFMNSTRRLNGALDTFSDLSHRNHSCFDAKYHKLLVDEILLKLGLDVCADVRVISCSGGQRKKLSIAQELVAKPSLLILDEPTSGLDSNTCFQVVQLLQQLTESSNGGMAIMATIHQPSTSVFNLFDMIYMISSQGDCMYHGPPALIEPTFSRFGLHVPEIANPADFAIEVAAGNYGMSQLEFLIGIQKREFYSRIPVKSNREKYEIKKIICKKQKFPMVHIWYHFERTVQGKIRDPLVIGLRTLLTIIFPLAMAAVFGSQSGLRGGCPSLPPPEFESKDLDASIATLEAELEESKMNQGLLFFTLLFITFNALLINCITLPKAMKMFVKETYNGWFGSFSFFVGTSLAEAPFDLVLNPSLVILLWEMTGQIPELWRFLSFNLLMIIVNFLSQSFGYIIGTIYMDNPAVVVYLTPLVVVPFMITSGIFVEASSMPLFVRYISQVNFLKYAMECSNIILYGFGRCGTQVGEKLFESRDALSVWLGAFLGTFDEEPSDNSTSEGRVSNKFVGNLVNVLTDKFIAKNGEVQSAVLVDLENNDSQFPTCWIMLIVLMMFKRMVAFYIVKRASKLIK